MAIGEEDRQRIECVDWHALYARTEEDEPIIPGIAFRGRWTAIAAPAKAGKSTVLLGLAAGVAKAGVTVLYLDREMGRGDILDRVEDWMQLKPDDLVNLHYSDLPPHLDLVQGASMLMHTVDEIKPQLVVIDGLNGVAQGAENDDTTWRDLFDMSIMPLKQRNIAVVSADNTGHAEVKRPRGHSTKLDKADAVLVLEKTDNGCKLTATHRRSASYPQEQTYIVANPSEEGPPMSVRPVEGDYPAGTKELSKRLDQIGVPLECGRREARRRLKEAGESAANDVLGAALRYRREINFKAVRTPTDHPRETPGRSADRSGGSPKGPPAPETSPESGSAEASGPVDNTPPSIEEIF